MEMQIETALISINTLYSSLELPFCQRVEGAEQTVSHQLYNILVSQKTSTVIPRLLVRKQIQGREWESRATKISSWPLFPSSPNASREHLGNSDRHQHDDP